MTRPCHFEPAAPRRGKARREISRRSALIVLLLLITFPVIAAEEKWWESYNRGVKAVNAKSYEAGSVALQKAIAQMPVENNAIRAGRNDIITYVPHFWLGIARFNLGDVDGAMREWKLSEDQGAIAKTDYYPKLRDWVARAQTEKERLARSAAGESKKAADVALNRALNAQVEALTAGGDRTDTYRAANRKLQEALGIFNSGGSNIPAYQRAEATALEARELFGRSAEEAKRLKTARAATPSRVTQPAPQPVIPQQTVQQQAAPPAKAIVTQTTLDIPLATPPQQQQPQATAKVAPPETKKEPPAKVPAVAQRAVAPAPKTTSVLATVVAPARGADRSQLESAYRAFAAGNLDGSDSALTSALGAAPSGEAFLLRGCIRYTQAMLSRNPEPLLESARQDFRAALKMNRSLRLDPRAFSPKLVAFFDGLRKNG